MIVLLIGYAVAHTFGSNLTVAAEGSCGPTTECDVNRICTFGSLETYDLVRARLFDYTGYPLSCINACSCTQNPSNRVQAMIDAAAINNSLYSNNEICSDPALHAAMVFITENLPCETIFAEARAPLFGLCGTQNGAPCMGKCTEQYQIDVPGRPCDQRESADSAMSYYTTAALFLGALFFLWSPDSLPDEGIALEEKKIPSIVRKTTELFRRNKANTAFDLFP